MEIVRDLLGGAGKPPTLDLFYNGDLAADSVTQRHKGSLVKYMDIDDVDNGAFMTFAGVATAMENVFGILEEDQGLTENYLPNDTTYGMQRKRITPIFPSSIIRAEYVQADKLAAANYDTAATCTKDAAAFTVTITTADYMIGGWIYMLNGAHAGYLHYITNNSTTVATLATASVHAIVATDDFLVISPPQERLLDFNATYTDIKSAIADTSRGDAVIGLDTLIKTPGLPLQRLDRDKHDGLKIPNAQFFHDFIIPNIYSSIGITGA
jgi:hypothetical protein